jgi:hypothetical protein
LKGSNLLLPAVLGEPADFGYPERRRVVSVIAVLGWSNFMSVKARCPSCDCISSHPDSAVGKKVRCEECGERFEVQPRPSAERGGLRTSKSAPARAAVGAGEEDDFDEERPRRRKSPAVKKGSNAVVWILLAAFFGLGLVGACAIGVVVLLLSFRSPSSGPFANVGGQIGQQNPQNNPAGLYGDQGGEAIAPADPGLPDTVLRARADDTFYKLSNPRLGTSSGFGPPRKALLLDYAVLRRGKFDGGNVVIHGGDGHRSDVTLIAFRSQERGTIEITAGFGPFGGEFPKNAELYMTRGDGRYGRFAPTFKVSTSVTMGVMPVTTKARNWTQEEIDRYTKDPPNSTNPNAHPTVGEDTAFLGDAKNGVKLRYVEPKGRLLGLEYRLGEWDKEKCVGGLVPIFTRDQPATMPTRVIAREGYAVAGAEIHTGKFVDAIRLQFRRIKPDGTLDPADASAGEWIGTPGAGAPQMLGNDGRTVLGIHLQQGAIINALALVMEKR